MNHYYNDNAAYSVKWLHHLMNENLIEEGIIDERSITDVRPGDLAGFTQCHFFAGIAGWSYALQLAGWPPDIPVWTASLPCQPFSIAGKRKGFEDTRHLWPVFRNLVAELQPGIIFGEQVSSTDGRDWFATVQTDLQKMGYVSAATDLCAAGVGAPHIRQRLYWLAYPEGNRSADEQKPSQGEKRTIVTPDRCGKTGGVAHSGGIAGRDAPTGKDPGKNQERNADTTERPGNAGGRVVNAQDKGRRQRISRQEGQTQVKTRRPGASDRLADAEVPGLEGRGKQVSGKGGQGPWKASALVGCIDGFSRPVPVEPGIYPLAPGLPGRMDAISGYGNSIVPILASEFIRSVMEYLDIKPE